MLSKQILYCVFNFALCLQCTANSLSGNKSLISPYKPEKTVNISDVTNLPEHTPEVAVKWTFWVYLMGSDLESKSNAGSSDLLEMMAVGSNPNVNVIVTTGGANKDNSSQGGINWRKINRWKIEKNNAISSALNNNFSYICSETLTESLEVVDLIEHVDKVDVDLTDDVKIIISISKL